MKSPIRVGRAILAFDKTTGALVEETPITLTLEQLRPLFNPFPDDPLMYFVYDINVGQAAQLIKLDSTLVLAIDQYDYQLDCHQL